MSLEATEAECAAVAVAPRVALADIEAAIDIRHDFLAGDAFRGHWQAELPKKPDATPLDLLSICILQMRNGYMVLGKSAPASPENFNRELGRKLAYEDAIRQLWPLMGFNLRQKLHEGN